MHHEHYRSKEFSGGIMKKHFYCFGNSPETSKCPPQNQVTLFIGEREREKKRPFCNNCRLRHSSRNMLSNVSYAKAYLSVEQIFFKSTGIPRNVSIKLFTRHIILLHSVSLHWFSREPVPGLSIDVALARNKPFSIFPLFAGLAKKYLVLKLIEVGKINIRTKICSLFFWGNTQQNSQLFSFSFT